MNNKCVKSEKDIEEDYDMVPMSQESMCMQNYCMMPGMNEMGEVQSVQGMNSMQNMQGMSPMQNMQGVSPMQNMQGMSPMQNMQGMNPMQSMQWMNPMQCMQGMEDMKDDMYDDDMSSSDSDECGMRDNDRYKPKDVDKILKKIERYNPGVFRLMRMYGVPYPVARRICRRIINLTLKYSNCK